MDVNQPDTNMARAVAAWGGDMPRWIGLLADACDQASQRAVADRIASAGFCCTSSTISKLLNRKYPASYAEPERAVLAVFAADTVACPLFGAIPLASCIRARRRKGPPQNYAQHLYAATCPTCLHNNDGRHDEGGQG